MSTYETVFLVGTLILFVVNLVTDNIKGMIANAFVFIAVLLLNIYQVVGGV